MKLKHAFFILLTFLILSTVSAEVITSNGKTIMQDYDEELVLIGGGTTFSGNVAGDLIIIGAGFNVDADVLGDLVFIGGGNVFAGTVQGNAMLFGGGHILTENSKINGDVTEVGGGNELNGIIVGKITGRDPDIISENRAAGFVGVPSFIMPGYVSTFFTISAALFQFLIGIALSAILLWVLGDKFDNISKEVRSAPSKYAWVGFVWAVVAALVLGLGIFTLILMPVSMLGWVLLGMTISISRYFAYPWMIDSILKLLSQKTKKNTDLKKMSLAVLVYVVILRIPIIGGLFGAFLGLSGFGALVTELRRKKKKKKVTSKKRGISSLKGSAKKAKKKPTRLKRKKK